MKNIIFAFIISVILHLLLLISYNKSLNETKQENKKEQNEKIVEKKSDVKFVRIQQEIISQEKKIEPKPEPKVTEKIIEKQIKVPKNESESKISQNTKKSADIKQAKEMQKNILKETNALQEKTLEDFLSQKESINKNILNELEKLYGEEYKNFTKVQKAYLEKNLNNFQVITQRVLDRMGYPELAAKQKIGGINTVEFIFYPNGDISDLRIINSSGYSVLDKHSIELIEIAYKDYPKPTEPIKIRFRVFYRAY
ncbi:MAG: TonB family protein [Aliarcobacter butzleri]|uniref:TonB family protein n=1 Tax=Aliarcobacter butzleri TaxID=28197 RepID=UPI0026B2F017|nr:TonB family protein [Aliarcobacter butzleri]MDY0193032.1 TonB family protein [Aliarcobacter butzleri]